MANNNRDANADGEKPDPAGITVSGTAFEYDVLGRLIHVANGGEWTIALAVRIRDAGTLRL